MLTSRPQTNKQTTISNINKVAKWRSCGQQTYVHQINWAHQGRTHEMDKRTERNNLLAN
jgi:hypothetical protein